jgi:hypothetical protein
MNKKSVIGVSKLTLQRAFRAVEREYSQSANVSGLISVRNIAEFLCTYGKPPLTKEESNEIVRKIASNLHSDELFDYEKYIEIAMESNKASK